MSGTKNKSSIPVCKWNDTHSLHPGVHEDLSSTEPKSGIPNQKFWYEIFGPLWDVSPVLLWEFILALLDTLKQVTLRRNILYQTKAQCQHSKIKFRPAVPSVSTDFLKWILGEEERRIGKSTTFNQVSCQILNILFFYVSFIFCTSAEQWFY